MNTAILSLKKTHRLVTDANSTSTITFEGNFAGATVTLQLSDSVVLATGIKAGDYFTVLHGQHRPVYVKISGGTGTPAIVVKTSNVA